MSKYGQIARLAAQRARSGVNPVQAWKNSASEIYPAHPPSRDKNCPRCAFLGLAEEGMIRGIAKDSYTTSQDNKRYAFEAALLLVANPELSEDPGAMWRRVMNGRTKQHNAQMDVVAALWKSGDLEVDGTRPS